MNRYQRYCDTSRRLLLSTLMKNASRWPASMALRRCANLKSSFRATIRSVASPGLSLKLAGLMEYLSLLLALTSPSTDALVVFVTRSVCWCTCVTTRWLVGWSWLWRDSTLFKTVIQHLIHIYRDASIPGGTGHPHTRVQQAPTAATVCCSCDSRCVGQSAMHYRTCNIIVTIFMPCGLP